MTLYDYQSSFGGLAVELKKIFEGKQVASVFMQGDDAADFLENVDACDGDNMQNLIATYF